jgi:hypothetical protein
MTQLYRMSDAPGTGQNQRLAYVQAENPDDAMTAASLLGIDPSKDRCAEVSNPESISDVFIGRLLNKADIAELDQFRADVAATADEMLEQLALEVAEIRDALDVVVVRLNRRQHAIAGGVHARDTTPVK